LQAQRLLSIFTLLLLAGHAPSCAETKRSPEAELNSLTSDPSDEDFDPFESYNRGMFEVNHTLDTIFIRPLAEVYGVIPSPARKGVRNVLTNLRSPVTFINDVLLLDFPAAGESLARTLINTTIGFGGLFDMATEMNIGYHSADFAETLAAAGLPSGPYLILPVLGPATPRDILGKAGDFGMNPVNWVIINNEWDEAYYVIGGLELLDRRKEATGFTDEIVDKAMDPYAKVRDIYRQIRVVNIVDAEAEDSDSPKPLESE